MKKLWLWIEPLVATILGFILYFPLANKDSAKLTWVLGGLLAVGRKAYEKVLEIQLEKVSTQLKPVTKLAETVDLDQECSIDSIHEVLRLYVNIAEHDFRKVKDIVIAEATEKLRELAHNKRSSVLSTAEYYDWLFGILGRMGTGSRIWAVSMMRDFEWDDSPAETRFLEESVAAAKRGALVERVFVLPRARLDEALTNQAVLLHTAEKAGETGFHGYFADLTRLERNEAKMLEKLGDGFLAFDDRGERVALMDTTKPDGQVRGWVTMSPSDLSLLERLFQQLKSTYTTPLTLGRKSVGAGTAGQIQAGKSQNLLPAPPATSKPPS